MANGLRRSGIEAVGGIPWDTHFCTFYHTKEELLSIVVPYIKAGLEDNEACIWVLSSVPSIEEATEELSKHFKDLPERMRNGQLEILMASEWYTPDGKFDAKEVLTAWNEKALAAKAKGFAGVRATGDTSWLHDEQWGRFVDYEAEIGHAIDSKNMLVLCTYSLDLWEAYQVVDVVSNHEFSLIRVGDTWRQIENSERRKATEDLLASEERYRRAVDNIRVAVYSALPDDLWTTVLASDKIEDITGFSAKEILSNADLYSRIIHPDDRERVWAALQENRKNKTRFHLEYRIVDRSGNVKWIQDEATPVLDEKGGLIRIDGFIEDITEKRGLLEILQTTEERFKLAQSAAGIGIWDWNIVSGGLLWSDDVEPIFGFEKGMFEKTYEAFLRSIHPEDRKMVEDSVADCVDKSIPYDIEHRIVWPDGSIHWVSEKGKVFRDPNGKPIRMLGVVQDITRQKLIQQEVYDLNRDLERRTAELAEANKGLEGFAYSASHDLRAPLRRIDGFSEMLLRSHSKCLDKEGQEYLGRIRSSVKNMDSLIEGMLRLSRLTTADLSVKKVDISGLARSTVHHLKATDPDRKVETSIQNGLFVWGDPDLLSIAVENLIGNSWKFTRKCPDAKIEFGSESVDGHKTYYVRDNGVGFDKSRADRMFLPFQRMHSDSEYEGHGIGLALVARVVSRHNGKIWAVSEPDKGATFFFTLGGRQN
jgi:PAS domain S-box-containing protein